MKRKKEKRSNKATVRFRPKVPKRKQAENNEKAEPERPSCPVNKLSQRDHPAQSISWAQSCLIMKHVKSQGLP